MTKLWNIAKKNESQKIHLLYLEQTVHLTWDVKCEREGLHTDVHMFELDADLGFFLE